MSPPRDPAPAPPLTSRATFGFAWNFGQALAARAIAAVCQIALAWLLVPDEWGLIGLAYTVIVFGEQIRAMGVREVLLKRQRCYHLWANPAAWLSTTTGVVVMAVMMLMAAPVARLYDAPDLAGVIMGLSLATPLRAISSVAEARLEIDLRFRTRAGVAFLRNAGTIIITVILAWLGLGAYSFVWSQVGMAAVIAVLLWSLTKPPVRATPQFRRWRFLYRDSARLVASQLMLMGSLQAATIVLGLAFSEDVVGLYYFSVAAVTNPIRMLTTSLDAILFPTLTKLAAQPARQMRAFLRSSHLLAIIIMPACALQAALVDPLVRLLLEDRWLAAIDIIRVLSLSAALRVMVVPVTSVIQSQGRFGLLLSLTTARAVIVLAAVTAVASAGWSAVAVAGAELAAFVLISPFQMWVAVRLGEGGGREVAAVYGPPALLSGVALAAGLGLNALMPATAVGEIVECFAIIIAVGLIYLPVMRRWRRDETQDLLERAGELRRGLIRRLGTAS